MPHDDDPDQEDGFTYGAPDPATYGGSDPATYGPQGARRYRVRLRRGDRRTVIDAVTAIDMRLVHSAVSSVSVDVPRLPGLDAYKFGTLELLYGEDRLFRGRLLEWPGPGTSETATLGAPGPGQALKRADLSVSYSSSTAVHEAIADVWRDDTPFSATVYEPSSPTTIGGGGEAFEAEGTALEVLQTLHELAGMRWTVQFQNDSLDVESYVPGEQPRTQAWDAVAHDATGDGTGYGNVVRVYGGTAPDGSRAFAEARDQAEIDALASDIGDGEVPIRVDDRTLTTDADCQARADAELADRLDEDSLAGELEIVPELVLPGYQYDIREWETDAGVPQLPVDEVAITAASDEAGATLKVAPPDGPVDLLAGLERGQAQLNRPS
jgi:hypothetical protein